MALIRSSHTCVSLLIGLGILLSRSARSGQKPAEANVQVDGITGIVHSRRLPTGLPLGGLGTGTIQVMTDGRISAATINNNWAFPSGDLPACFAAIHTRSGARTTTRVLALNSTYDLPVIRGLEYDGLFPVADLAFTDPSLPVSISTRAFSPLIPHDIRNSSFPAAAFIYRVKNMSAADVEICIAFSWENTLGVGGTVTTGAFDDRTGNSVASLPDAEGFFAQKLTRPFGGGISADARLKDNAAGEMTIMAAPGRPQAIVASAGWNALDQKPAWWDSFERDGSLSGTVSKGVTGKIHPAAVLTVRVTLKPRETVDLPFAVAWYTPRLNTIDGGDYGHYYQTIWPDSYAAARGLLTEWRSLLALTEERRQRIMFSNLPRWMARRLINCAAPVTQHSVFTRDQNFALLESVSTSRSEGTTLPSSRATQSPSAAPQSPSPTVLAPRPGTRLASLTQRMVMSELLTDLFPVLSARELRLFMALQADDGALPRSLGDVDHVVGAPQAGSLAAAENALVLNSRPFAPLSTAELISDSSSFLLQVAQYVFRTGDHEFLHVYFPNVRRTLTTILESRDLEGLPAPASGPLSPAGASLFLAALQAGARMCRLSAVHAYMDIHIHSGLQGALETLERNNRQSEDNDLAVRCEDAMRRAAIGMDKRFWNGALYTDRSSAGLEYSSIDQLIGVALSDLHGGQGPAEPDPTGLLPEANVAATITSIHKINEGKPADTLAPLAHVPLAPADTAPGSAYCDIGATILGDIMISFTRGRAEAAVATLRRLDDMRNNSLLSPWQSPARFEAGVRDGPMPAGASIDQGADWNLLAPMQGFSIDLTSGQMDLSPAIPGNWRSLASPVFAPTFWGRMEFRPTARGGLTNLSIDRLIALPAATGSHRLSGSAGLVITRVRVAGPPPRPIGAPATDPPVAHVSRGTIPLGVKTIRHRSGDFILIFETPVKLTAGDRLEIDLH